MNSARFEEYLWDNEPIEKNRKYIVLIIYDIISNKRRIKFSKYLCSYGIRVQKSAFEAILDERHYDRLIREVPTFIHLEDNVRIYRLLETEKVVCWGSKNLVDEEVIIL